MSDEALRACEDPDLLAALHAESFPQEPWDRAAFETLLAGPGVWALALCSEADGDPLGFALLRAIGEECEVLTLCVRPMCRGDGHGRVLLTVSLARAQALGCRVFFLEVAEDNPAALGLYRSFEFKTVGRRENYYRRAKSGPVDALVLRLNRDEIKIGE